MSRLRLEEGWTTVWLLAALQAIAAMSIQAAGWTFELWITPVAAVIGVLAGLALAKSRFHGALAAVFALIYGAFTVGQLIISTFGGPYQYRMLVLVIRLNNFIYYALNGGTSRDILPFTFFLGLIFWSLAVLGAWSIFRQRSAWLAILPAGAALLVNAYFYVAGSLDLHLAAYLVLSLLILARLALVGHERGWRERRLQVPAEARPEFLRAGLTTALVIVGVAWALQWLTPTIPAPQAVAAWNSVNGSFSTVRENFERLFNAVRNPGYRADDFYGDSLSLGRSTGLTDREMFVAQVVPVDAQAENDEATLAPVARLYWRSITYQTYSGSWTLSDQLEFRDIDDTRAGTLPLPAYRLRRDMAVVITTTTESTSKLFVLPQPQAVDRDTSWQVGLTPAGQVDPVSVRALTMLQGEDRTYRVVSSVSIADAPSLRSASREYPSWISATYLQLPATVTTRTRDLARQIVAEAGAINVYDQTQAITSWLRKNITYDLGIDPPPEGSEPVDHFLFESQRGYCNYYATAEVVLLRSLGIPARMSVGFTQGRIDPKTGEYRVIERNAHAWPEVYFPEFGWIEFEPTASEPELNRPERETEPPIGASVSPIPTPPFSPLTDELEEPTTAAADRQAINVVAVIAQAGQVLGIALVIIVALALLGVFALFRLGLIGLDGLGVPGRQVMRLLGQAVPGPIAQAYLELERAGRWLEAPVPANATPRERAAAVGVRLPDVQDEARLIASQYMTQQYSRRPEQASGGVAQAAWQRMRGLVWRTGARRRWEAFRQRWIPL
ncbi:MAG: hypothetical protein JNL73_00330 [Anaerolineales bacterium]|nr:hypothetical protein [Anaerolineales bacterium]